MRVTISSILILILISPTIFSQPFSIRNVSGQTGNTTNNELVPYTNNNYNFTIQYPQGWLIQENQTNLGVIVEFLDSQGNSILNIGKRQYGISQHSPEALADSIFSTIQNKVSNSNLIDEGTLTVSSQDAYFIEYSAETRYGAVTIKDVFVEVDSNDVYVLSFVTASPSYQDQIRQFDNVVSTFELNSTANSGTNYSLQQGSLAQVPSYNIPSWIKNTAKWWAEGSVTDDDFIKGVQYLIQQGIIQVPPTPVSSQQSHGIPSWVKNTAKWWAEGSVTDDDFVKGVQYLVQNGIIVTQNNTQQTMSNPSTLGYSTPPLLNLPTQQTPELAPPELGTSKP